MAGTGEILEAVRARLAELPLCAEFWPEDEKAYYLTHPAGAALVGYAGAKYAPPRDTEAVVQRREITLPVILVFRQLNGPDGAVDMLDRVRAKLLGFRPPDCTRLKLIEERFAGHGSGLWWYEISFSCTSLAVEIREEADGPLLTRINYESSTATAEE